MVVSRALKGSLTSRFLMRNNYQIFMISAKYLVNDKTGWFDEMLGYGNMKMLLEENEVEVRAMTKTNVKDKKVQNRA